MSLKHTNHTNSWKQIPKKCKNCFKSIYTVEEGAVYYHCSIYGKFKKDCDLAVSNRSLPKPEEILEKINHANDSKQ